MSVDTFASYTVAQLKVYLYSAGISYTGVTDRLGLLELALPVKARSERAAAAAAAEAARAAAAAAAGVAERESALAASERTRRCVLRLLESVAVVAGVAFLGCVVHIASSVWSAPAPLSLLWLLFLLCFHLAERAAAHGVPSSARAQLGGAIARRDKLRAAAWSEPALYLELCGLALALASPILAAVIIQQAVDAGAAGLGGAAVQRALLLVLPLLVAVPLVALMSSSLYTAVMNTSALPARLSLHVLGTSHALSGFGAPLQSRWRRRRHIFSSWAKVCLPALSKASLDDAAVALWTCTSAAVFLINMSACAVLVWAARGVASAPLVPLALTAIALVAALLSFALVMREKPAASAASGAAAQRVAGVRAGSPPPAAVAGVSSQAGAGFSMRFAAESLYRLALGSLLRAAGAVALAAALCVNSLLLARLQPRIKLPPPPPSCKAEALTLLYLAAAALSGASLAALLCLLLVDIGAQTVALPYPQIRLWLFRGLCVPSFQGGPGLAVVETILAGALDRAMPPGRAAGGELCAICRAPVPADSEADAADSLNLSSLPRPLPAEIPLWMLAPGLLAVTSCGHLFHARCLASWYAVRKNQNVRPNCPACAFDKYNCFELKLLPPPGAGAAAKPPLPPPAPLPPPVLPPPVLPPPVLPPPAAGVLDPAPAPAPPRNERKRHAPRRAASKGRKCAECQAEGHTSAACPNVPPVGR